MGHFWCLYLYKTPFVFPNHFVHAITPRASTGPTTLTYYQKGAHRTFLLALRGDIGQQMIHFTPSSTPTE